MSLPTAPKVRSNHPPSPSAERFACPCPTGLTQADVISPELALVSPQLAKAARLQLPDRPWEVPLRRSRPSLSRCAVSAALVPKAQFRPTKGGRSHPLGASGGGGRRRQLLRGLVFATVVGALAVPAVDLDVRKSGYGERVVTTSPPARTPSAKTQVKAPSHLLPNTGYVVSPGGSFMTSASGRTIEFFTLPLRCGSRQLVIQNIPVPGRSLRFAGKAVGRAITVRLSGRLVDREHVRGVVVAHGSLCNSDPVAFSARVS